jgi:hypothetical protein
MEDPQENSETSQDQAPVRKTHKYRVRKSNKPTAEEVADAENIEETAEQPRKRIVQIAKKIMQKKNYEDPIPGSIEEDFLLEN